MTFFTTEKKTMEEHFKEYKIYPYYLDYYNNKTWENFKQTITNNNENFIITLGRGKAGDYSYVPEQEMNLLNCLFPNSLLSTLSDLFSCYFNSNDHNKIIKKFKQLKEKIKNHMNNKLYYNLSYEIKCSTFGKRKKQIRNKRGRSRCRSKCRSKCRRSRK